MIDYLNKGDLCIKDSGHGFLIWMRVTGMTRRPQRTRCVEAFSPLAPNGEGGDTSIHDVLATVTPEQWADAEARGWNVPVSEVLALDWREHYTHALALLKASKLAEATAYLTEHIGDRLAPDSRLTFEVHLRINRLTEQSS